jgi:hypothetical protein
MIPLICDLLARILRICIFHLEDVLVEIMKNSVLSLLKCVVGQEGQMHGQHFRTDLRLFSLR